MFSKYFLLLSLSLSDILLVTSQSETDYACLRKYKNKLSSDYLLGDWYPQYRFTDDGNIPMTPACDVVAFTTPTAKEIQDYKAYYSNLSRPFSFEEQPLRCVDGGHLSMIDGMVFGLTEVKFYVHDPKSVLGGKDRYHARAIRRIDDHYHLFLQCDLRGNVLWLYSRQRNNSEQELQEVIKRVPEFRRKEVQKFCAVEEEFKTCK